MKLALLSAFLALPTFAQVQSSPVVACKVSLESTQTMKALYGGKVPLYSGNLVCKNYTPQTVSLTSVDVYLALSTIDTMPAADAMALLNKVYQRSATQELTNTVTNTTTAVGGGVATGFIKLAARSLGWEVFGAGVLTNVILPLFTAGQPNLTSLTSNQCDSVLSNSSLAPGGTVSCQIYIQKPGKGVAMPGAVSFDMSPNIPPPPSGLPVTPPPVMLHRQAALRGNEIQANNTPEWSGATIADIHVAPAETHPQVAEQFAQRAPALTETHPQVGQAFVDRGQLPPKELGPMSMTTDLVYHADMLQSGSLNARPATTDDVQSLRDTVSALAKQLAALQSRLDKMTPPTSSTFVQQW